jgi:excisionase family DNA binding protein
MAAQPLRPRDSGQSEIHPSAGLALAVPPELVDAIAGRVVDLLEERGLVGQSMGPEPWLGVDEAAAHLASPPSRVYDLVAQRRVRHARDGRRLLFRASWLDEALEEGAA